MPMLWLLLFDCGRLKCWQRSECRLLARSLVPVMMPLALLRCWRCWTMPRAWLLQRRR